MNKIAELRAYNNWLKGRCSISDSTLDDYLLEYLEETEKEIPDALDEASIDYLHLSVRARNILFRNKIRTIGDLKAVSPYELSLMRNMGRKTLDEITDKLSQIEGV